MDGKMIKIKITKSIRELIDRGMKQPWFEDLFSRLETDGVYLYVPETLEIK